MSFMPQSGVPGYTVPGQVQMPLVDGAEAPVGTVSASQQLYPFIVYPCTWCSSRYTSTLMERMIQVFMVGSVLEATSRGRPHLGALLSVHLTRLPAYLRALSNPTRRVQHHCRCLRMLKNPPVIYQSL